MPLSKEFIDALIKEKDAPSKSTKLIRHQTQYPQFPVGGLVKWHDTFSPNKSLKCASRGCTAPTCYTFKGIPYCTIHLILLLNLELIAAISVNAIDEVNAA